MKDNIPFTAHHHAILFACVSKAVISRVGEDLGAPVIREAVRTYGRQRGRRMALRARGNGHPLTVENYLAYGEWEVPKGEMKFSLAQRCPDARLTVFKCPWYEAWEKEGVLAYGRYFCQEIDGALVNGFNPDLAFSVQATRSNDGTDCEFVFEGAHLTLGKVLGLLFKKKITPGRQAVMPWDYHSGHLFKVLVEAVSDHLQPQSEAILDTAFTSFTGYFSQNHLDRLKGFLDTDFGVLPR